MHALVLANDLEHLRGHWGWLLALGVALVLRGIVALSFAPAATLAGGHSAWAC